MSEDPEVIEWTGDNFAEVRDFCRRESDGFSAAVYRDGGALFLDAVCGTTRVNPGERIIRVGPDAFEVPRTN
jgi:hypothetical protein